MTSSSPRVLHLITRWLKGGAEAKTRAELAGLGERYEFHLAHGAEHDPEVRREVEEDLSVPCRTLPALQHYAPHRIPAAIREVRGLLDELDPDVLHVHSTEAGAVGRWAARGREELPVVYTLHGMPFGPNRSAPLRWFVRNVERVLADHTTVFAANAQRIVDTYLEAGIGEPDQYEVVYSGVDLERLRSAEPADELAGTPPRVLFAGRLAEGKGIGRLVRAVETLRSRGTEAELLLAGTGPLGERLDRLEHPWLHRLGFREDLPSVMKACEVLALPSEHEGTPRVVTEAMACGLPVVASDVGGIPEQIDHGRTGRLIDARDSEALVDELETLLADEGLREAIAKRALDDVERFSREHMLERTDALYQRLLDGR